MMAVVQVKLPSNCAYKRGAALYIDTAEMPGPASNMQVLM